MGKNDQATGTVDAQVQSVDPAAEAAKKEAQEAAKKAKLEARKRVIAFLSDNKDKLGSIKADIELLIGKGGSSAAPRTGTRTVNSELRDAFLKAYTEGKGLTEMDVFKAFKVGRPEMVTKIRILVLCPNPDDRVWVKFDEATETYNVVGLGKNPPTGWDGYIPSEKSAL
jgi:hypothetical protein